MNSKANVAVTRRENRASTPAVTIKAEKESSIGTVIGENKPAVSVQRTTRAVSSRQNAAAKQTPSVTGKSQAVTNRTVVEKEKISSIGDVIGKQQNKATAPANQENNKGQIVSRTANSRRIEREKMIVQKTPATEMPAVRDREGLVTGTGNRQTVVEKSLNDKEPLTETPVVNESQQRLTRRDRHSDQTQRTVDNKTPVNESSVLRDRSRSKGTEVFREGGRVIRSDPVRVTTNEARELSRRIVPRNPELRHGRVNDRVLYYDRTRWDRRDFHNRFVFRDYSNRFCYRTIWPGYYFWVNYRFGRYSSFCYVRPYYLRRYIFVSLGGWWPYNYTYLRYYWYGWHPYSWYGYYPVAYQIPYDNSDYYTYNYYTYNYYNTDSYQTQATELPAVDEYTFADVRERMAQEAAQQPGEQTLADKYFDEGVNAFDLNSFNVAADKFAMAMQLAPDDMILPFAYAQSLFAMGSYTEAAEALRAALQNVKPDQEGVFYPRGLYHEDSILLDQIDELAEKAKLYGFDADLQLLLGYQLLGIGETDEALEHLQLASQDMTNAPAAMILLELQRKITEEQNNEISNNVQTGKTHDGFEYTTAAGLAGGTEQWQSDIGSNWPYAAWLFGAWQPQMLLVAGKRSRFIL